MQTPEKVESQIRALKVRLFQLETRKAEPKHIFALRNKIKQLEDTVTNLRKQEFLGK